MKLGGAQLRQDLRALGLEPGMTVLVHSSCRSIGRIDGGADTLRDVLLDLLGSRGTLVAPTQTRSMSVTSTEFRTAVAGLSPAEFEAYVSSMPGFDVRRSPSEGMGVLTERLRLHPDAFRSDHPTVSFAAVGALADKITSAHPRDCLLGEHSPMGRLYEYRAMVLFLGIGFDKCTAFHLGEEAAYARRRGYRVKIGDIWWAYCAGNYDDSDFAELGSRFEDAHGSEVRRGPVGAADCRLFPLTLAADFAERELPQLRQKALVRT